MNTNPNFDGTLNSIIALSLGGDDWQTWVDRYLEQYDALEVDGYTKTALKSNYTFQQIIASTGATPLPTWADPEAPGYEVALRSLSGKTGNIPTAKQFYRFNRVIMREQLQLLQACGGNMPAGMQGVFMGLMDESTDGLIKSYHNALVHYGDRINSTGKFTLSADNNPRGYQDVVIDFGIPASHFETLTGNDRWFTDTDGSMATAGTTSDPVKYCKNKIKSIHRDYHINAPIDIRVSSDLWDAVCEHPAVRKKIAVNKNPLAASDAIVAQIAAELSDEEIKERFAKIVKANRIIVRDSKAYVDKPGTNEDGEKDLVTVQIDNFERKNISFIPAGNIGNIQGVKPISLGYDPDEVAYHDGGRLMLTTRSERATHSIYVESEFAQICVPSNVNAMFISTVTA